MCCVMLDITILDVWAHSIITPHRATLHKLQDTGQIKVRRWDDVMLDTDTRADTEDQHKKGWNEK